VGLRRGGRAILEAVSWCVGTEDRWVVLGPNGSGKTSLLRIAALWLHPTSGEVEVLGERLGRADIRRLRARIGLAGGAVASMLRPELTALDVVVTARYAALEPWWHDYDDDDRDWARSRLDRLGVLGLADRTFGTLSDGERQRVLLARSLMGDPALLLLDEPAAGLDLGGREQLVTSLESLAADAATPPVVFVTHHVEEIPPSFTHLLLLRAGRVLVAGPLAAELTAEALSACFGVDLVLEHRADRWQARAAPATVLSPAP
jgi:iron complex transport system ATP-binding protein